MQITVLYFASLREIKGCSTEKLVYPTEITIRELVHILWNETQLQTVVPFLRFAVNEEFATLDTVLVDGDVVAFLPPVGGG